jgi:hypothetical protein
MSLRAASMFWPLMWMKIMSQCLAAKWRPTPEPPAFMITGNGCWIGFG